MPNVDTDAIAPMKRLILNTDQLGEYSFEPYRFLMTTATRLNSTWILR